MNVFVLCDFISVLVCDWVTPVSARAIATTHICQLFAGIQQVCQLHTDMSRQDFTSPVRVTFTHCLLSSDMADLLM